MPTPRRWQGEVRRPVPRADTPTFLTHGSWWLWALRWKLWFQSLGGDSQWTCAQEIHVTLKPQLTQPVPLAHVPWKNMLSNFPLPLSLCHYPEEKVPGTAALDQQTSCVTWQVTITSEMLSYFHSLVAFTHLVKLPMAYKAPEPISTAH